MSLGDVNVILDQNLLKTAKLKLLQARFLFISAHCMFSRLGHTHFFYFWTICRFSWNGTNVSHWRLHDNRHMNTSAMFQNSKFYQVMLNVEYCFTGSRGRGLLFAYSITVHELAQSSRACNIFNFVVLYVL
jgi:hypothetical protein